MNLYEEFDYIVKKDQGLWNYYRNGKLEEYTSFNSILSDPINFICKYLGQGGKDDSPILGKTYREILISNKKNPNERPQHTISVFFLGLLLYKKNEGIQKNINKEIEELNRKVSEVRIEFNYYWFLICFFHDILFYYKSISKENAVFTDTGFNLVIDGNTLPLDIPRCKGVLPLYEGVIKNYYQYREYPDHGIIGGLLFYNDRFKKYTSLKKDYDSFEKDGVWWSKEIVDEVHAYVSWIIMAHNIWFCTKEKDIETYKEYNLNELVITKPQIRFSEYPLFSLLCTIDTLDPVKKYTHNRRNLNSKDIPEALKKIKFDPRNLVFSDTIQEKFVDDEKFNESFEDFTEWVDISELNIRRDR